MATAAVFGGILQRTDQCATRHGGTGGNVEPLRVITRRTFLATAGMAALGILAVRALRGGPRASSLAARPLRADDLQTASDDGALILTPRTGGTPAHAGLPLFRLNATAALIWHAADGSRTGDEIAIRLAGTYGLPLEQARRDTACCLAALARAGLVTTAPA